MLQVLHLVGNANTLQEQMFVCCMASLPCLVRKGSTLTYAYQQNKGKVMQTWVLECPPGAAKYAHLTV